MEEHTHISNPPGPRLPPPDLHIPESSATVQVRVIDTGTKVRINPKLFWQPEIDGFTGVEAPIYCFLVSRGDEHVLFDLGVRPDWTNYAPSVVSIIKATTVVTVGSDIPSVLDGHDGSGGLSIRSADVRAVIWSHNHFDHIGDVSRFPPGTELVVGPGTRAASWPGWPRRADAIVLDRDAEGRTVREISFRDPGRGGLRVGRFDAYDYFGDGSFYLLDAPGHAVGHLCALARTQARGPHGASSFVFMGADACHHAGILRPSGYLPLPPDGIPPAPLRPGVPCPWDVIQGCLPTPETPFFTISRGPLFPDPDAAADTVRKIQELDAADNVLVLMAHDLSLRDRIPLFPNTINAWRSGGLKEETRWLFCHDFWPALCDKSGAAP